VLRRVREEHPKEGLGASLMRLARLDAALERAEERVFNSIIAVLKSSELDTAIRESIGSTFSVLRAQIGKKRWRQHLGIQVRHHHVDSKNKVKSSIQSTK